MDEEEMECDIGATDLSNHHEKNEVLDLRMECKKQSSVTSSSTASHSSISRTSSMSSKDAKARRRNVNLFKKNKLKYRYLLNRGTKHGSDSGNFGSSSMMGSSSNASNGKTSTQDSTTSPSCTSSSPLSGSGASNSPQTFGPLNNMPSSTDQKQMCMMLGQAVPLIVMMQGQLQSSNDISYSSTVLFKCNMCNMFSNHLPDVLNHVTNSHSDINYCFVCHQFHANKSEFERHKEVCATACQAFQQIIDGHYRNSRPPDGGHNNVRDQALNLSVAEDVAKRAAQIIHSKKSRRKKMKNMLKCSYCKKAFFGRFYLQRHLRSHTGEKACHCDVCGKGFAEWRNLRNHMVRFHNGSESASSRERRFTSVSPNGTSDSDDNNLAYKNRHIAQERGNGFFSQHSIPDQFQSVTQNTSNDLLQPTADPLLDKFRSEVSRPYTSASHQPPTVSQCSMHSFNTSSSNPTVYAASNTSQSSSFSNCSISSSESTAPMCNTSFSTLDGKESPQVSTASEVNKQKATGDDVKTGTMYLGSTSSRLELSHGQQGHEQSLNPISNENGEKIFRCSLCNKIFKSKFAMQRHLDFHADIRPYECNQCDYKAKTGPQLKVHLMRHNGNKQFYCHVCDYASVTHSDLNRHCKSKTHLLKQESAAAQNTNSAELNTDERGADEQNENEVQSGSVEPTE